MALAKANIYKVEWHDPPHGVAEHNVQARTRQVAINKAKRKFHIKKGMGILAKRIVEKGQRVPYGLQVVK